MLTSCEVCGAEFVTYPCKVKKGWGRFCSNACHNKFQTMDITDMFWRKVHKTDTCWLWTAATDKDGYGLLSSATATRRAHRYSYELHKGAVPQGLQICHTCDVKGCVNPDHLYAGTELDNARDRCERGQQVRGERSNLYGHQRKGSLAPNAKLDESDIPVIFERYRNGESQQTIADSYSIHQGTVSRILRGAGWVHATPK